jgi:alpha-galactosidase
MMNRERCAFFLLLTFAGCRSTPPEQPRSYEAESPQNTLTGSAKTNSCRPCSGGKNVGDLGGPGRGILRFNGITAANDQDYLITFYYSNGSPSDLTASVGPKNSPVTVVFPPSGGWMNIATVSARVHLSPAANSIEVLNNQGHFVADIDRIMVAQAPPVPPVYEYEAESPANTFQGSAKPDTCNPCSGGKDVGNIGGPGAGVLQFNGVEVKASATYQMTIRYANGSPGTLKADMYVNDIRSTVVTFPPTGGWVTLGTVVVPINLNAGKNTIRFSNADGYAADLDKITILEKMEAFAKHLGYNVDEFRFHH